MKNIFLAVAVVAVVICCTQCKKSNETGTKQHIVLTASNGDNGSKVNPTVSAAVLGLTWEGTDVITVTGGATGTLALKSGEGESHATFEGDITKVNDDDLVFTFGSVDYDNEAGTLEWVKNNICLEGKSAYSPSGEYDVDMLLTYALLKLDLSSLGTAGGNTVTVKVGPETKAKVLDVTDMVTGLYVALPTDNKYGAASPAELIYTFMGNDLALNYTWTLVQNMYYTKGDEHGVPTGDAIVIAPGLPALPSAHGTNDNFNAGGVAP